MKYKFIFFYVISLASTHFLLAQNYRIKSPPFTYKNQPHTGFTISTATLDQLPTLKHLLIDTNAPSFDPALVQVQNAPIALDLTKEDNPFHEFDTKAITTLLKWANQRDSIYDKEIEEGLTYSYGSLDIQNTIKLYRTARFFEAHHRIMLPIINYLNEQFKENYLIPYDKTIIAGEGQKKNLWQLWLEIGIGDQDILHMKQIILERYAGYLKRFHEMIKAGQDTARLGKPLIRAVLPFSIDDWFRIGYDFAMEQKSSPYLPKRKRIAIGTFKYLSIYSLEGLNKIPNVEKALSFWFENNLIDTISSEDLETVKHVQSINLSNNRIDQLDIHAFDNFSILNYIDFADNYLTVLPAITFNNTKIFEIDISNNMTNPQTIMSLLSKIESLSKIENAFTQLKGRGSANYAKTITEQLMPISTESAAATPVGSAEIVLPAKRKRTEE